MTRLCHSVDAEIDLDLAIALGLSTTATCGVIFTPRDSGGAARAFSDCPDCFPVARRDGKPNGSHRTPIEVRQAFPHYVYRYYDSRDRLLYVGCSYNPAARLRQHKADKKTWASQIARTRFVVFPDRRKALDMERLAIETEHPIHNRQFKRESA